MSATTLLGAVVALFDTSEAGAAAAASGGLWVGQIPADKPALPFVALLHLGEVPVSWTTEEMYTEAVSLQFHVFDQSLDACEALAALVKQAFDWSQRWLAVDGAQVVGARRTNYRVVLDGSRDRQGNLVYHAQLDYEVTVCRMRDNVS